MKLFRRYFSKIPLLGHLSGTSWSDHWTAIVELTPSLILSTLPFWLGSIVIYVTNSAPDKQYLAILASTVNQGELLIFSTSLLAPFFYMALHDPAGSRAFPSKLSHAIFVVVITVISSGLFSLLRANVWVDLSFVLQASIGLTLLSLFLIYLAMVYHRARLRDPGVVMREGQHDFVDALAKHRS